jgi:hypothetical protein
MVVIDGSGLWMYRDCAELEQVKRARLVWWNAVAGQATPVDVVTLDGLDQEYLLALRDQLVALTREIGGFRPRSKFHYLG